jgi:enoyl-CoA hydratase/3-hydroxyacyl-CoA dehydrogenase
MPPEDTPDLETLRLEYPEPSVAHLVLNRPDNLNSVNKTVLTELSEVMDIVEEDSDVRALLITGAGDAAFCGGADLQFMGEGLDPFDAVEFSQLGQRVFGRLAELSVPVVAGIDGFALGGGMELATCVDLCVASESAEFGQPEINLGILPAWGGTQRLSRLVGERRAREIVFTAERYDAETMYDYGFVNEVVDDDEIDERALEVATDLAAGPPLAHKATKMAMHAGRDDIDAGLQAESDAFGLLWTTEDTREGIDAFHDRREPEFEGK